MITNSLLSQAQSQAQIELQKFAQQPDFIAQLQVAFGDRFDSNLALDIASQFRSGDFSLIPDLRILSNGELGDANGAYAGDLDEIFVSSDFLAQHPDDVNAVAEMLLEEIGHKLDRLLNGNVDSPGDEGAIFRLLATGQTLAGGTLAGLKTQNDHAEINVGGQAVAIEMNTYNGTPGNDYLIGTSGDDTFYLYAANGGGVDYIDGGGGGYDYLGLALYGNSNLTYTSGTTGTVTSGTTNGTIFTNIEQFFIVADSGNDYINFSNPAVNYFASYGGSGNDTIIGGGGSGRYNFIQGEAGDDSLVGGAGNDNINGGIGNDSIYIGFGGADTIDGGAGNDSLNIESPLDNANTNINYTTTTTGTITRGLNQYLNSTFKNVERLYITTGTGADNINIYAASDNFNYVNTGDGNDTINGSANSYSYLVGGDGDDYIYGGSGGEGLDGGNGNDYLFGGAGNDYITGGAGDDTIEGGYGNDSMNGGTGDDIFYVGYGSNLGVDTIDGGAGNDYLAFSSYDINIPIIISYSTTGGAITGGSNNGTTFQNIERFYVSTNSGDDYIDLSAATGGSTIYGGVGNDYIYGGVGNDTIDAGAGNDLIYTKSGADSIDGGAGIDSFILDNYLDTANTTISFTYANSTSTGTITGGFSNGTTFKNIEQLNLYTGAGADNINTIGAFPTNSYIYTGDGNDTITTGSAGNNYLYGQGGDDNITGGLYYNPGGIDYLEGGAGNDTLTGGGGTNYLIGGLGDDTYIIDVSSVYATIDDIYDTITEATNSGNDTLSFQPSTYDITVNLSQTTTQSFVPGYGTIFQLSGGLNNIETVIGGFGNDNITGNALDNIINGGNGNDTLLAGAGNDTIYSGTGYSSLGADSIDGGTGNDYLDINNSTDTANTTINYNISYNGPSSPIGTITGGSNSGTTFQNIEGLSILAGSGNDSINISRSNLASFISGGDGNDYLAGGTGNDTLSGGAGNDTLAGGYGVNSLAGGTGDDTYFITYPLGQNLNVNTIAENVGEGTDTVISYISYTLDANVENLKLYSDFIPLNGTGNSGNNLIEAFASFIGGGAANNVIDGGAGADTMIGGMGDDTYVVDNIGDVVTENLDEGTDTVQSSINYNLGVNLENLTLFGTDNINGTGNALDNIITGNAGNNILDGGAGNDTIYGGTGDDFIGDYSSGNDTIYGEAGNDSLYGGAGNDSLYGGLGNDSYYLSYTASDLTNDTAVENPGEGIDTAYSIFTVNALAANVENLSLLGTGNINGTGNSLDNQILGNAGNNTLDGGAGNDFIANFYNTGTNTLIGGEGNDVLYGGGANDTLIGGNGNDTYYYSLVSTELATDTFVETATGGYDTAITASSVTQLADNIETLYFVGTADINGTGNSGDNLILGNSGNNSLFGGAGNDFLGDYAGGNDTFNGGAGNDILFGGTGIDSFVFSGNSLLSFQTALGVDNIADFTVGDDIILLSKGNFGSLTTAAGNLLLSADFATVTTDTATTLGSSIVYNSANGKLFYDANGAAAGFGTGGQFAQLSSGLGLTGNQFKAIA
jgi:Ca2+-binding RTX toxin-like protein